MSRIFAFSCATAVFLIGAATASAQDSIALREIRELRQVLDQQSKQIETLTQQVMKLNQAFESQKTSAPAPAAEATAPSNVTATPEIPKAEPVTPGNKHVVAKGETLTSIAKQHNVGISELQKANRIENDRKLQIGQTLTIPASKPPETSPERKPNP